MSLQLPYCSVCKIPMTLKEKNGDKFFGCSNFKVCKTKTQPYYGGMEDKQSSTSRAGQIQQQVVEKPQVIEPLPPEFGGAPQQVGEVIILEELQGIRQVLEEILKTLKQKHQ